MLRGMVTGIRTDGHAPGSSATRRGPAALEIGAVLVVMLYAARHNWLPAATPLLLLAIYLRLRTRGLGWAALGLSRRHLSGVLLLRAGLLAGAITGLALLALRPLAEWLTDDRVRLHQFDELRGNAALWGLMLLLGWTYAAFGEELIFRGFLLNRLADLLAPVRGRWIIAAVVQAIGFGMAHGPHQGPAGMTLTGLIGLMIAAAYGAAGRNLWLAILTHGLIDTIVFTAIFLNWL